MPYLDWINSIKEERTRQKIQVRIDRLRLKNKGKYKSLGSGVFELKIDFGPGYRVYFAQNGGLIIILLGGSKNSQNEDIKKAKTYWGLYKKQATTQN
jgi:putative addiction module killer protein